MSPVGKRRYQPRIVDLSCILSTASSASPRHSLELDQTVRLRLLRVVISVWRWEDPYLRARSDERNLTLWL